MAIRKSDSKNMKKQNNLLVPYFAQNDASVPDEWKDRACGIACVAMITSYYDLDSINILNLIQEGLIIGGYTSDGWNHSALVNLIRNNGLHAYSEEFRSVQVDIKNSSFKRSIFESSLVRSGIEKITYEIDRKRPVIVSMQPHFRNNNTGHLIVILGYEGTTHNPTGFHFHDPDSRDQDASELYMDIQHFEMYWRKFAIFSRQLYQI